MGIKLASNFELNAPSPIDTRFVFEDNIMRDILPDIQRYEGLLSYVKSENKFYVLQDGVANENWTELNTGGSATDLAKITAIEKQIGNIASVLDKVNGVVI